MGAIFTNIAEIFANSGWAQIFFAEGGWKYAVMIGVACVLLYLAIVHQFEPLLLLPIGFGMLMTNLPLDGIFHMDIFINETQHINWELLGTSGGMADYIYLGVKLGIYPPLIFLGIGTMTDFEPLIARPSSLLLGNLMKECGVVERIKKTAGNELMNIITIFLGFSVGCTTNAATFLNIQTVEIIVLGIVAFGVGTAGGFLLGKVMCFVTHGKINPLIGSAGVSAVPMAARVSQKVGQEYNPRNYLLMHAMGPNVAGVIGSAVAAGILINMFG